MSEEGPEPTRSHRTSPAAAPASLPDDGDLLREVFLRLPPQPSSLPRASFVCKRWRRLATDPQFLRRFVAHHRKPPLLGVFQYRKCGIVFSPILDPPDRIHPERFSLPHDGGRGEDLLGCRHGRVLLIDRTRNEVIVCDPITGEDRRAAVPPEFHRFYVNGTVLCAAGDQGHMHGGCHSSPFKVVLVSMYRDDHRPIACVYSSETGAWGNLISTPAPHMLSDAGSPGTLVGNAIYWLLSSMSGGMLEFDLDSESLAVIEGPPDASSHRQIIQAEDGGVDLAVLSYPNFQMWQRKVNCHGAATWMLRKTINMHNILGHPTSERGMRGMETILGYAEDGDVIFLHVGNIVFMVQLESMQSRRLYGSIYGYAYHPFTSFYSAGTAIAGGCDGADT